jgi:hypothetical protein
MTSSEVIERVAIAAYRNGVHPLDLAEVLVAILAEDIFALDDRDPRAIVLGRRICGALLDAQWTPPAPTETP